MNDNERESLPLKGRSLQTLLGDDRPRVLRLPARLLGHFGRQLRSLSVCCGLLLFASVAYGAGSYQRTKDGKTLVWNNSPKVDEVATWSGRRDKKGFATGSGTLTWYTPLRTMVTGSLIPDTRSHVVRRYSGKMVHGKFKGTVTRADASAKRSKATSAKGGTKPVHHPPHDRQSPPKKATPAPSPAVTKITTAKQTPAPTPQQTATPTSEHVTAAAAPVEMPAPEEGPSPAAEESPPAVQQETAALAAQQTARPTPGQQTQPDTQSAMVALPTPLGDSLHSLTRPPANLPKPTPTLDAQTVARLDTLYQAAVKDNDVAVMDQILDNDFVFVTDRGVSLTKADVLREAREKRTIYERQEEVEGTQKVRIWRDTAIVTALLRIKGTRDQNPFDYKVWLNQTYVRTPVGWRYVFGKAAIPFPEPAAK